MENRLKELRKELGLTQQEFADRLRISRSNVATYEVGKSVPGEATIALIVHIFGVNEKWLRYGQGPMFSAVARDQQIMDFVANAMRGESDNFKRRLISVLARLDENEWAILEKRLREIIGDEKRD